MTNSIIACIDGPTMAAPVADAAGWVSQTLSAPLSFIHVLDPLYGEQERSEHAKVLDSAKERVGRDFGVEASTRLLEGRLLDVLREVSLDTRVLIVGKRGESAPPGSLGSNLSEIIRASDRPTMIVTSSFVPPKKVMVAFDGSETMVKAVNTLARSPLFKNLECHVVMVGAETDEHTKQLAWAERTFLNNSITAHSKLIVEHEFETELNRYAQEFGIDMMVMGAYSHNKVWQLIMGSKTAKLLMETRMTALVLRQ